MDWEKFQPRRHVIVSSGLGRNAERFKTSLPNATVHVYSKDDDGRHPYVVDIYDESGELTLQVTSETGDGSVFEAIETLYEAVYQSATNVDPFLESLIRELEDEDRE
ncbi:MULTISPECIES: hypothetical protein [unclassified Streptomyces]|uniref:hypothetical protein n=1 Tax=unclassified Streptomyces TaxID=2593676 RepID=UPI001FAC59C3|nr:hypothetical protein [Streptomyces sp. PBSH9]